MIDNGKMYIFKNVNGKKVVRIKEWIPCNKTLFADIQIFLGFLLGIGFFVWSMFLYGDARDLAAIASFFTFIFSTFNMIRIKNKKRAIIRDPWCDELWMLEDINIKIKE